MWVGESDGAPIEGWLPTLEREEYGLRLKRDFAAGKPRRFCLELPQPARLDGRSVTYRVIHDGNRTLWPQEIE